MNYQKFLIFSYAQLPLIKGCETIVSWDVPEEYDGKEWIVDINCRIYLHPYMLVDYISKTYGPEQAFNMLRLMINDRIISLGQQLFNPLQKKINELIYDLL